MILLRNVAALAIAGATWTTAIQANPAMPLPDDATPVEAAAYAVLEKHCARCHQEGALEGRKTPAGRIGYILDIRGVQDDTNLVVKGEHLKSGLYNIIGVNDYYDRMPQDCEDSSCYPTTDEMAALESWINEAGNQAPPPRPVISLAQMYEAAHLDLLSQPANRRDRIRYFSLRPIQNDPEVSAESYQVYADGTVKLMNALSWNPTPYKAQRVGPEGILMRVFLPDLNWDHSKWAMLEHEYPYGMTSAADAHLGPLQQLAGTQLPIIRADWFAATAGISPMYYDMLGLPDTVQGLEALLGIDMIQNIKNEQVVRAGFQNSGVSSHNRLIERHPLGTGFLWTSYDFAGSAERQSFFRFPLGPKEAFGEEHSFDQDGGESIFTLPNGFHAYYLNTADGKRLNTGPTQIVHDSNYGGHGGEVMNGISCMSCHENGIKDGEDKVRDVAMLNLTLPPDLMQTIDVIYPGKDAINEWYQRDTNQFLNALRSAGIEPGAKTGGYEPARALYIYHKDKTIKLAQAASELGYTVEELQARMAFVGPDMATLMLRLNQSPIARDEWTAAYPRLLERVTTYRPIETHVPVTAHLSHTVQKVVGHVPAPAPRPHKPVVSHAAQSHLTVYTDKPTYKVGEGLKIFVEPRDDCRLTLLNVDSTGHTCVLFPHPALADHVVKGGSQFVFPPQGALRTSIPGSETVKAICDSSPAALAKHHRQVDGLSCDPGLNGAGVYEDKDRGAAYEALIFTPTSTPQHTDHAAAHVGVVQTHDSHVAKAQVTAIVKGH